MRLFLDDLPVYFLLTKTKRIPGAREEDLTDPHPVLRLNRPAQHRRFAFAFGCLVPLFLLCLLFLLFLFFWFACYPCLFVFYPSWFPCLFDKVTLPSLVFDVIKLWTSSYGTCDKINDRCAILLGLRDTENDHGLIKVILLFICNILYTVTSFGHRLQNQP